MELHAAYCGTEEKLLDLIGETNLQKDRFHMDESGHATSAQLDFPVLLEAIKKADLDSPPDSIRAKLRR